MKLASSPESRALAALIASPRSFVESGKPYHLLEEFLDGRSLDPLRPLLKSQDPWIQRAVAFVVAELGSQARPLVEEVPLLLKAHDKHAVNYAMESLLVCATGEHAGLFSHVIRNVGNDDRGLRLQAMDFVARAAISQLDGALQSVALEGDSEAIHRLGLEMLLAPPNAVLLKEMLASAEPLSRRYGAIEVKRRPPDQATALAVIGMTEDPDVKEFLGDDE